MRLKRTILLTPLILLLFGTCSAAMARLLPGENINVSSLAGAQSEVGIAVNPADTRNLVAISNNIADLSRLGTWLSQDGGETWTANFLDENEDGFGANDSRFDPNVAFDSDGNVYVIYSITGTGNRLVLARSTDGGQNFNLVTTVATDTGTNNLHTPMVTTRSDGGADDVLVVWARVQAGGESIEAALSLDAGASFPNSNNNINDALQRTFLPWASVDENGDFHVTWEVNQGGGAGVILHDALDRTTLADDANDQVTTVQITDFAAATSKIPAQPDRGLFSVSTVDVDRSTGRIYLSYTDRPNTTSNDTDIFVRFSDDNGANWSARTQVNDDETTTSQFMPRMAIDQTSGVVFVTWYDARNDVANNQQVDVFVSASFDEGLSWSPNQRVTEARSDESTANPQRDLNNYGEYFGLTAHDDVIVAAWTDARAANFTAGTNEDVYTATVAVSIDHFLLYAVDADDDELELILMLADQFESAIHKVDEVERLGNPVDKNGEGISDADTHLVAYEIDDGGPKHEPRSLRVTNQFGEHLLETDDPEWLLVPSLKSLDGPIPDDVLPDPFRVDHFKCYEVELSKGAKFKRIEVPLQDQFMQEPRQFVVLKPAHLCNPVDKQGEGIENEDGHLVCYGLGRVRHKSVRNIHVNNQFGPLKLETEWERELCVPSTKEILGFVEDHDDHDDDRR